MRMLLGKVVGGEFVVAFMIKEDKILGAAFDAGGDGAVDLLGG